LAWFVWMKASVRLSIHLRRSPCPAAGGAGRLYIDDIRVMRSAP